MSGRDCLLSAKVACHQHVGAFACATQRKRLLVKALGEGRYLHCKVQLGTILLALLCPDKPLVEGLAQGDVGEEGQGHTGALELFH